MIDSFKSFVSKYDTAHTIVLLEGKRAVLEADKPKLIALGKLLAESTRYMKFRSGNADGADFLFSSGIALVDAARLQVITPYEDHRKKARLAYETFHLDQIDLAQEPDVIYQSRKNKKTEKLIDPYLEGNKNRITLKAAYILRDTIKVTGTQQIPPASFGIFYDDLNNPNSGGTGHTMQICKDKKIPLIDQRIWFDWLK